MIENSPINNQLTATIYTISDLFEAQALALYGWAKDCPSHLTMPCNPCPDNCKTCDVHPSFHCE